ncbi:MAG: ribosome small subunit-dependent GTPase A, partial [Ignavibacteria bacterium]|nr:ribosome small subunit-dependent GTPase A [Ignavibacteria bacterium]
EDETANMNNLVRVYNEIGYQTIKTSAEKEIGIEEVRYTLKNKLTLLSGNSGVGKSTLINRIAPGLNLKTGDVSGFHQKGTHTTTFAEIFDLPFGAEIIDTPGIKEFGILDLKKEEVSHYFPEMDKLRQECKFNNCIHINEPGCAVTAAVASRKIAMTRYNSYLSIINEIETDEKIYD